MKKEFIIYISKDWLSYLLLALFFIFFAIFSVFFIKICDLINYTIFINLLGLFWSLFLCVVFWLSYLFVNEEEKEKLHFFN